MIHPKRLKKYAIYIYLAAIRELQNIKQAVGKQPTCCRALYYRQRGAAKDLLFLKSNHSVICTLETRSSGLLAMCCIVACYLFAGETTKSHFERLIQKSYIKIVSLVSTQIWFLFHHKKEYCKSKST